MYPNQFPKFDPKQIRHCIIQKFTRSVSQLEQKYANKIADQVLES